MIIQSLNIKQNLERKEKRTYCMDDVLVTEAIGFRFDISRIDMLDNMELQLCLRYKGVVVKCGNILFGKFFPLSLQLKHSYFYQEGIVLTYSEGLLRFAKTMNKNMIKNSNKYSEKK